MTAAAATVLVVAITAAVLDTWPIARAAVARGLVHLAGLIVRSRRDEFLAELAFLQKDLNSTGLSYAFGACLGSLLERLAAWSERAQVPAVSTLAGPRVFVPSGVIVGLIAARGTGRSTVTNIVTRLGSTPVGGAVQVTDIQLPPERSAPRCGDDLIDNLSVAENILIADRAVHGSRIIGRTRAIQMASDALARLGIRDIDPASLVGSLDRGCRALVALAVAVQSQPSTIIFEDPSLSTASRLEVVAVLDTIRRQGIGVVMISHDIGEICSIADRITVLRNGEVAYEAETSQLTPADIIRHLVGEDRPLSSGG